MLIFKKTYLTTKFNLNLLWSTVRQTWIRLRVSSAPSASLDYDRWILHVPVTNCSSIAPSINYHYAIKLNHCNASCVRYSKLVWSKMKTFDSISSFESENMLNILDIHVNCVYINGRIEILTTQVLFKYAFQHYKKINYNSWLIWYLIRRKPQCQDRGCSDDGDLKAAVITFCEREQNCLNYLRNSSRIDDSETKKHILFLI